MHHRSTFLVAAALAVSAAQPASAAEPSINKMGIVITAAPHRDKPEWTWTPTMRFKLQGPLSSAATIEIEYTLPNGKPFVKAACENVSAVTETESLTVNDCGYSLADNVATNQTGVFGFTVRASDELAGKKIVLATGKFTVGKQLYNPSGGAQFNKQFYYYVDNDWRLPIAYIGWSADDELLADTWVKKQIQDQGKLRAYLFLNGKQVAEATPSFMLASTPLETYAWHYQQLVFRFPAIIAKSDAATDNRFRLYENPGSYEVKVLRDGKLTRTFTFTIGRDGKPTDSGAAVKNGVAKGGALVPAAVLGDTDGPWNKDAWKTQAMWSNPLTGFGP